MSKRLGIIIGAFVIVSILLLGASFAKESGNEGKEDLIRDGSGNLRIVYSNKVINKDDKDIDISIINRSDVVKDYVIKVEGITDYSKVKYKLDGEDEKQVTDVIYIGALSSYVNDGDYKGHNIEFIFEDDLEFNVTINEYNGEVVYGS